MTLLYLLFISAMLTSILLGFLVPTTLGIIAWAYNLSHKVTTHSNTLQAHYTELSRLDAANKETDNKYMEILKMLMEIKVEINNKKDRD